MGIARDVTTGVQVTVQLDRQAVRDLARAAARRASGFSAKGGVLGWFTVREVHEAERGVTFVVAAPNGNPLLKFLVEDEPIDTGGRRVRVALGQHVQAQTFTTFGIPTDRRRVQGFPAYAKFVQAFADGLEAMRRLP
ncbi:MAG TPA: hypothetical protein VE781_08035 [Kineosporiaceae bacterium]|nr:hypothetical protein [Kineosporiaceae bacterium]